MKCESEVISIYYGTLSGFFFIICQNLSENSGLTYKTCRCLTIFKGHQDMTACLVQWLARLFTIQEVPGSIPGYTLEILLEVLGLERGPPSFMRPIGQPLNMRSSEIRLRKQKLKLRDNALLTTMSPVLPSGSNQFSRSWHCAAVAPRI